MVLMLNCSLKTKAGNTQFFLELLKHQVSDGEIKNIRDVLRSGIDTFATELEQVDALVIGAPLYVDGLPAQAVKLLEVLLEKYQGKYPNLPVYVVSNLGFYEAGQIKHLLDMVRNWCVRMGCAYGGGLAVGAGPLVSRVHSVPVVKSLNKDISKGVEALAKAVNDRRVMDNYYTKTMIPRSVYLKAAHMTFDKTLKDNGVTKYE